MLFCFFLYIFNNFKGQTLAKVGVDLGTCGCFSHGQLYVALSRVRDVDHIRVLTTDPYHQVRNPVVRDILDDEEVEEAMNLGPDDQAFISFFFCKIILSLYSSLINHHRLILMSI